MKINKFILSLFTLLTLSSCNVVMGEYTYENADKYIEASELTLNDSVETLNLSWVSGNVSISLNDENKVYFKETTSNYPSYYYYSNNVLNLEYCKSGTNNSEINNLKKNLEIKLPKSMSSIKVNLVNGNISLDNLTSSFINLNIVNGNINASSLKCNEFNVDKVSGSLTMSKIIVSDAMNVKINTVAGDDKIYIYEEIGYSLKIDSLVSFSSEFDDNYEYGNQLIKIDYDSVGSKLSILKDK